MGGGSGFINNVMNAQNVNFGTVANSGPEVLTDAQLMIGNTVFPNIRTGTLTSTGGSVAITYVAPNINLETAGGAAITNVTVDANTAPGTNPVVPTGAGNITITGAQAAAGTISTSIRSDSLAANTVTIEVQRSSAQPVSSVAQNGVSHFDSATFTVDANGFVQLSGSAVGQTITGDTGGALSPTAGNWNIVGGPGVTTTGAGDTLTINSVVWTDQGGSLTVAADSGTFDVSGGTATFTLPAAPNQGEECRFVCINSGGIVKANAGQQISIGNTNSTVGGTATSTQGSDTLYLVYNAGTLRWFSIANNGNWTLA